MNIGNIWCWFCLIALYIIAGYISYIAFSKDYFTHFISLPFPMVSSSAQLSIPFAVLELCRLAGLWAHVLVQTNSSTVTFSL